ncbi:MAG: hypothetical protein H0X24_25380 [Ktedonobacterales bacterium]|nr:hypothetical protein [Ktedonobacterales bacterium]
MQGQFRARLAVLALSLTATLALGGCRTVTSIVPASAMKVSIDIKDFHQGKTQVGIHFADGEGNTIEFVHGETITCDGVFLAYDSNLFASAVGYGAYTGEVPLQPAGGKYTLTFKPQGSGSAAGTPVTVAVAVVDAPVTISQPASGATVAIPTSSPLAVRYNVSGLPSTGIFGIVFDSRAHSASALTFNEPGSLSFKAEDFLKFAPGPGTVSISRGTGSTQGGSAYAELKVNYENITTEPITWQ